MKATGIVRRIDDLGRVVIPKEIRRTLRLREGTPLEIFTDREGEIILKKYSPMMELTAFSGQYAEAMAQSSGLMVCITDRDQVVAVAGGDKRFLYLVPDEVEGLCAEVIVPIICEGDAIGSVALFSRDQRTKMGDTELKLAQTAAGFLGRQMEN